MSSAHLSMAYSFYIMLNENTKIDLSFFHWSKNLLHPHEQVKVPYSNKIFISIKKKLFACLSRIFSSHLKVMFLIEMFEANVFLLFVCCFFFCGHKIAEDCPNWKTFEKISSFYKNESTKLLWSFGSWCSK